MPRQWWGILQAAFTILLFWLPVVNIGGRQLGRAKASNVIDVDFDSLRITKAIKKACSVSFRRGLGKPGIRYFFGNGHSAEKIVRVLEKLPYKRLLQKKFVKKGH
jgi:UDP-N-acetylglucosamine 2-epimerase (non-hydrolysing)/GDP/UDP-N,N'-diacetylbacillosamine 2-epimerase (hydrolysing)